MHVFGDIEFLGFELSHSISSMDSTQVGFILFTVIILIGLILTIGPKSKGRTESFRDTIRHDKKPLIGLLVVLPIFLIGYIWAFLWVFRII